MAGKHCNPKERKRPTPVDAIRVEDMAKARCMLRLEMGRYGQV